MKIFAALALLAASTAAQAANLEFAYPCRAYRYVGQDEVATSAPNVASYTFVKTAKPNKNRREGENKWTNDFSIRVALQNGGTAILPLGSAESGDEGYNSYRLDEENAYWIATGSIYTNGSGGSFEGQDDRGGNVFFECRK